MPSAVNTKHCMWFPSASTSQNLEEDTAMPQRTAKLVPDTSLHVDTEIGQSSPSLCEAEKPKGIAISVPLERVNLLTLNS